MRERIGKDYFKRTSIAMGMLYIFLGCVLAYCLCIIFLPNVARWVLVAILAILKYLSFGDDNWYLFNVGFFFTCLVGLILVGIILNVIDYINYKKEMKRENIDI